MKFSIDGRDLTCQFEVREFDRIRLTGISHGVRYVNLDCTVATVSKAKWDDAEDFDAIKVWPTLEPDPQEPPDSDGKIWFRLSNIESITMIDQDVPDQPSEAVMTIETPEGWHAVDSGLVRVGDRLWDAGKSKYIDVTEKVVRGLKIMDAATVEECIRVIRRKISQ